MKFFKISPRSALKPRADWGNIVDAIRNKFYGRSLTGHAAVASCVANEIKCAPITNMVYDLTNPAQPLFYQVRVDLNSITFYGA